MLSLISFHRPFSFFPGVPLHYAPTISTLIPFHDHSPITHRVVGGESNATQYSYDAKFAFATPSSFLHILQASSLFLIQGLSCNIIDSPFIITFSTPLLQPTYQSILPNWFFFSSSSQEGAAAFLMLRNSSARHPRTLRQSKSLTSISILLFSSPKWYCTWRIFHCYSCRCRCHFIIATSSSWNGKEERGRETHRFTTPTDHTACPATSATAGSFRPPTHWRPTRHRGCTRRRAQVRGGPCAALVRRPSRSRIF